MNKYQRAKLSTGVTTVKTIEHQQKITVNTVYNVNSILGSRQAKWILGIIHQREDGHYYLEDSTLSTKLDFSRLETVDDSAFFTEGSLVLCRGFHNDEQLSVTDLLMPPLHAKKSSVFKVNEADYFGAYTKKKLLLTQPTAITSALNNGTSILQLTKTRFAAANDAAVLPPPDNCIVVISQIELDLATTQKALPQLLTGLEEMRPHIIVVMGDFVSQRIADKTPYEGFRQYFESISQIAKDNSLTCLKEQTEWIFVPSVDDPGMTKMMPCMPLAEYFLTGPRS